VDGQCGKLVAIIGYQFITLIVDVCVQHDGCEALLDVGMSAAAETCVCRLLTATIEIMALTS